MPRSRRVLIGIHRDAHGLRAVVKVRGRQLEKRFPLGTPFEEIQDWREHTRAVMADEDPEAPRHSLAADVRRYLRLVQSRLPGSYPDRVRDLAAWVDALGEQDRRLLRLPTLNAVLQNWRATLSASTVNHRRDALSHLYRVLDGTPGIVARAVRFPLPQPRTRAVPLADIDQVLRQLRPGSRTRIRLTLMRWTGMRPSQMARLTKDDIGPAAIRVPAGKRGRIVLCPLATPEAKAAGAAFRAMPAAWGEWSCPSANKALTTACEKAGVRPFTVYQIRHSFALALRAAGADLADVQALLGHVDQRTTLRYAPTIDLKLQAAVARLAPEEGMALPWGD